MKPNPTEQEIASTKRRMRVITALGLAAGKALTLTGRKKEYRPLRIAGRTVILFSLLSSMTLAFLAFIGRNDKRQRREEAEERRLKELARGEH